MKKFIIPILILVSSFANASTLEVCNFPSGISPLIRIYDATISTQTQTWTNTGVVERQVDPSLAKSCYLYTSATLTAGHAYQVDWKDQAVPTKIASESLYEVNTYVDAAVSSRSTYAGADTSGTTTLLGRIPGTVQPQTGDAYARLGAPSGASIDADILTRSTLTGTPQTGDSFAIVNNNTYGNANMYNVVVAADNYAGSAYNTLLDANIGLSAIKTSVTSRPTATQIRQEMDANSTKLANLDASISSRSTYAGGAVASVTGNVGGNVTGSVGSISGVSFPTNFSVMAITAGGGAVTVGTNTDKTGYALTSAYDSAKTAASQSSVNAIPTNPLLTNDSRIPATVIAAKADIPAAPDNADIAAIKTKTDQLTFSQSNKVDSTPYGGTVNSVSSAVTITPDVWDELSSAHTGTGTMGAKLNVSDPLANQVPGSYAPGTAGNIIGKIPSGVPISPSQLSPGVLTNYVNTSGATVTIIRGDTPTLTFNLGTGWNLTNKNVYFTAKASATQTNSQAIVNRACTVTDAINGVATIILTATETQTVGTYAAEIEVRNSDDTSPLTARQFMLKIIQDVRQ